MLTFCALVLLYFLPAIVAHNKEKFLPIFLLNFFLGWTVIGWFGALIWALAEPDRRLYAAPLPPPRFCCACGRPQTTPYCPHCGRAWA